jgi:hypothetical protein
MRNVRKLQEVAGSSRRLHGEKNPTFAGVQRKEKKVENGVRIGSLLYKLGFSDRDSDGSGRAFDFSRGEALSGKLGSVFYFGGGQAGTRFYWIECTESGNLPPEDLKIIHKRVWNENKADLLFLEKQDIVEIKYAKTSPKHGLLDIDALRTDVDDAALLERISKEHITTGAFWIEYNEKLREVKKYRETVDTALVDSLITLRKNLHEVYRKRFAGEEDRNRIVHALIDRTLFVKFLEDKGIINANFYSEVFGNEYNCYKDLLLQKDKKELNRLFCRINEIFNNKLFKEPVIKDEDLLGEALSEIAHSISGTKNGQLCLFDFRFDIIPVEFISHIYQVFFDDKKAEQGIFYTPKGLAELLLNEVIPSRCEGKILDPSCGSGIFLVLAFRKMYPYPNPSSITDVYEEIKRRLEFIKRNIFGIEVEDAAVRLAMLSLYLEVLSDIPSSLVSAVIRTRRNKPLFSIDFSENIQNCNALTEEDDSPFLNEAFSYIVGNPPWFTIDKESKESKDGINDTYWNRYKDCFSKERQISQCFLHRIKKWSTSETKFGFIVNSSNFINESDNFRKFVFSSYRIEKFFELYHLKKILFEYATEPACLLVFDNQDSQHNSVQYFLPQLNSFAETFQTILLNQGDVILIEQNDLLHEKVKLRDFLIGTEKELALANKLEQECIPLVDLMLSGNSRIGYEDWGEDALRKEFKEEKTLLPKSEYNSRKQVFFDKYYSEKKDEEHPIPFIKAAQLRKFGIDGIDKYCRKDIENFHRNRKKKKELKSIYEEDKILCPRIGGEIKAFYSDSEIYFGTDIFVIKLQNPKLYHALVCCLNSELVNYFVQVKLRKRIDAALSRLDSSDLEQIPVPKRFNGIIVEQLTSLSKGISAGCYSFEDKKDEINNLVFDLYDLDYIERQRVSDFFTPRGQRVDKKMLEEYCKMFFLSIKRRLRYGIANMGYSSGDSKLPLDLSVVNITFGESKSQEPPVNQVQLSLNYHLLKQIGGSQSILLRNRIYTDKTIFIIKDATSKNWTKSAAYDDARAEIAKLS